MKTMCLYLVLLICTIGNLSAGGGRGADRTPVDSVDYGKYLGRWYEIARFDNARERNLVAVTATYSLNPDGTLRVYHEGFVGSRDGKRRSIEGKAKLPGPGAGRIRVSYMWLLSVDYFILELDAREYSYALIAGPSPDELWIMSRTPRMPLPALNHLLRRIAERGFDVRRLVYVDQS